MLKYLRRFKSFLLIVIFAAISFDFPFFAFNSPSYALDEGGATTGIEYRAVTRDTSTNNTDQYEMNYHLDVWQKVPNVGNIVLWLDWINGKDDVRVDKLGRGYLSLTDFRYNGFVFNGLVGDSTVTFTNLTERFTNVFYPDIYVRGFKADLLSDWGIIEVFGGRVARLEGLLGKTYDITDESLYGFKGNFRPIPTLLLGTGFIRTQDEVDSADKPVTKSNNIFLFDSEFQAFNWVKWQTEFRLSSFKGEPGTESRSDYLLRFGPIIKTEDFKLEANFRHIGTDYRFVNQATQGASDQEGFFLLSEYKPWKELTLFGNADRYYDNVSDQQALNRTDNTRGLIGLSFFSPQYPSFYLTFDATDQKTRFDLPSPINNLTSTFYSEVRYEYKDFNPYARYRWVDYRDKIQQADQYVQNDIVLGLRKNLRQGSIVYIEGESNQKKYSDDTQESILSGKIGFNYYLSANLSCWGEAIYYKLKDREDDTRRNKIEGGSWIDSPTSMGPPGLR